MLSKIINQLRATSSTNGKLAILGGNKENELLRLAMLATLNPFYNFYIRVQMPAVFGSNSITCDQLHRVVDMLQSRRVTGNAARDMVNAYLESLTEDEAEVMVGIINRDLDCGVAEGTVNKVWPKLIPEYPCLLASPMDEKIARDIQTWPGIFAQNKYDGGRVNIIVDYDGSVQVRSRNGKELKLHNTFDQLFRPRTGMVFDGEILVMGANGVLNRQTSNGIMNKAVRGTISAIEADALVLFLWDVIPLADFHKGECPNPYKTRISLLDGMIRDMGNQNRVFCAETHFFKSLDECQEYYNAQVAKGEEGAILKHPELLWSNTRSKRMVKLKQELEADLEVIGWSAHTKDSSLIGSLTVKTSCGELITSVGSGLTDDLRKLKSEDFIGRIVKIKYNAVIKARGASSASLFLPVFMGFRDDKDVANSLQEL